MSQHPPSCGILTLNLKRNSYSWLLSSYFLFDVLVAVGDAAARNVPHFMLENRRGMEGCKRASCL